VREPLSKFVINIPADIQEQSAIGSFLSDLDDEISLVEVRLNKTRDLKQGMMQELLTGRTRLV
jgi:type I restriction enzyme S subunit